MNDHIKIIGNTIALLYNLLSFVLWIGFFFAFLIFNQKKNND